MFITLGFLENKGILHFQIIGLAFEVHDSYEKGDEDHSQHEKNKISPSIMDVVHYSFCYVGVLTGPYFSYKTFCDYLTKRYEKFAPCESITLKKIKFVPLYMVIFLISSYYYPIEVSCFV